MANEIKWKPIEHSLSQQKGQGKHVILVAYKPAPRFNEVVGVLPMYDLRDMNLDGSASTGEIVWLGLTTVFDPYEVFGVMNKLGTQSPVLEAAIQLRDYKLKTDAESQTLISTHKACARALTTLMIENILSPGIELNLARTGLQNLGRFSEFAQFIVQQILETVIMESICATRK